MRRLVSSTAESRLRAASKKSKRAQDRKDMTSRGPVARRVGLVAYAHLAPWRMHSFTSTC
eukprot:scaffold8631_cov108-Isochrysis_galbana.AAC.25